VSWVRRLLALSRVRSFQRHWPRSGAVLLALPVAFASAVALLSAEPDQRYHAVAVMPVREELGSANAHLLPNGRSGLSQVVARTAQRLQMSTGAVSRSIRIEDSRNDPPTFFQQTGRTAELRVRSIARNARVARRIAGTVAEEYVRYRREVLEQEAITAIASLRTRAEILGASDLDAGRSAEASRRAETLSTALVLDTNRLGVPRLQGPAVRSVSSSPRRNVLVGGILGVVLGLLVLQIKRTPGRTRRA